MSSASRPVAAWSAAAVAAADAAVLATGRDLMSVAATALAQHCAAALAARRGRVAGARVVLLVGPGNNGGDALFAGALLAGRGVGVTALLAASRAHPAGLAALLRAGGRARRLGSDLAVDAASSLLAGADLAVDGILGIGARGAVRGPAAELLAATDRLPGVVVACDLPSGVDPDSGAVHGPVLAADLTVTFGAAKPGLLLPPGAGLVGRLTVVDLGLAPHLPATPALVRHDAGGPDPTVAARWPWPWEQADKYARGVVGIAAGSARYPGAAVLALSAAAEAGAGLIRYLPPQGEANVTAAPSATATASPPGGPSVAVEPTSVALAAVPEAIPDPLPETGRVQAWLVGPGTTPGDERTRHVLDVATEPAVVDAGAIEAMAARAAAGTLREPDRLLLTPHAGELARLLDLVEEADRGRTTAADVTAAPLAALERAVAALGATVLLKGARTLVGAPDGRRAVVSGAPAWLATAGAGDVLAGLAAVVLAGGRDPFDTAVVAAYCHARAARLASAGGPLRASAVARALPGVVAELSGSGSQGCPVRVSSPRADRRHLAWPYQRANPRSAS